MRTGSPRRVAGLSLCLGLASTLGPAARQAPTAPAPAASESAPALAAGDLHRYPLLQTDVQARYVSSYDRTGGNDDGFEGTYSALYVDDRGEHVIFDHKGPGIVYTMWFTSREHGYAPLGWGRIRFYFDDEPAPRLDEDVDVLFEGEKAPFVAPLIFGPFQSTGGYVSYVPLPFASRLRITTERRAGFYNVFFHTFAADRDVASWTGEEDLSSLADAWRRAGSDRPAERGAMRLEGVARPEVPLQPDGDLVPTVTRLLDWSGAGTVVALRVNPLMPLTKYQLNHLRLRIYWDGAEAPAVDAPLGGFFGSGLGEAAVRALPLGMSPSGDYYCHLPMPFWRSVRVDLVNENPDPVPPIRWQVRMATGAEATFPPARSGYFHARSAREWPTSPSRDYVLLDTTGRGVYVGQVMTVEPLRPEVKRWWEGDLRVWLDGRRHPALQGTGHEDEYLGGWSNEWLMNPYSLPMHGEPATADLRPVDFQWSAATTVYRFFAGGIPYQSRIRVSTEHGTGNGVPAMYSSVVFYYERPGNLARLDTFDVGDVTDERTHGYRQEPPGDPVLLASRFEGGGEEDALADAGREVAERSRFTLRRPAGVTSLRLRRLYDQSASQEAEVWIDGARAGTWYHPAVNADRRWAEDDFVLPAAPAGGGGTLDVEIRVVGGRWTEYRYELWGVAGEP